MRSATRPRGRSPAGRDCRVEADGLRCHSRDPVAAGTTVGDMTTAPPFKREGPSLGPCVLGTPSQASGAFRQLTGAPAAAIARSESHATWAWANPCRKADGSARGAHSAGRWRRFGQERSWALHAPRTFVRVAQSDRPRRQTDLETATALRTWFRVGAGRDRAAVRVSAPGRWPAPAADVCSQLCGGPVGHRSDEAGARRPG